jgi:hypothetical protein
MTSIRLIASLIFIGAILNTATICTSDEKPADKILIEKKARRLTLLRDSVAVRNYKIALGNAPDGCGTAIEIKP